MQENSGQFYYDIGTRNKMKRGVDFLANTVKATLGPKGRKVVLEKESGANSITRDGYSIATLIEMDDPIENMGAKTMKELASEMAESVGDGTTTAIVLAQLIIGEGLKKIASGANPMDLKRGIDLAVAKVVEFLTRQSQEVGNNIRRIEQIAAIAAGNDNNIGKLIAQAFAKIGREGIITIEEAKGGDSRVDIVRGLHFDRGYVSPYFVTNSETTEVELENPYILLYDKKISAMRDILNMVEKVARSERPLLIVAENLEGEALATLVVNKLRGTIKIAAVCTPGFSDQRRERLQDIAILTGGIVIEKEQSYMVESADLRCLGTASRVIIDRHHTTIVNGKGKKKDVTARVNQLKAQIEATTNLYDKEKLKERLIGLTTGIAIIYVGAVTEKEMSEMKDRVSDALFAARAAVDEGIGPGGGVAYIRSIGTLERIRGANEDETSGIAIIKRALEEPLRQIVINCGIESSPVVQKVKDGDADFGFNANAKAYQTLFKAGVIDPTRVTRTALEKAASAATLFLTMESIISEKPVNSGKKEDLIPDKTGKHNIYFSYAWGEDRERVVDQMYDSFVKDGYNVVRDKKTLHYKDLISDFMKQLGKGSFIILALSDKYLRSENCMFELYEIFRNSELERAELLKKIYPIRVEDLDLLSPKSIGAYFNHWQDREREWENLVSGLGVNIQEAQLRKYRKIKKIVAELGDLLDLLSDINCLTSEQLSKDNFAEIKNAIKSRIIAMDE